MPYEKKTRKLRSAAVKNKRTNAAPQISRSTRLFSSVSFPIIGVGASAGGLAAFEAFFSSVPSKLCPNMAFVLVQHLAPDHKSLLSDLVQRYTKMVVCEVEDGIVIKPNSVYVIPPNKDLTLVDGKLFLSEPLSSHGLRMPIDYFFKSLAKEQRELSIGVILSGNGSDGTLGLRAIKIEGGMVIIQSPESSEYDGMPTNAIHTKLADFILSPKDMIPEIIKYINHPIIQASNHIDSISSDEKALSKIFILLKNQFGHDFSKYKPNTIIRRIERRMAINQVETTGAYLKYLQDSHEELESLFADMLIGVTRFFRDPSAFEILYEQVIKKLFDNKDSKDEIRVWSAGCSTGEEAYSLAILLSEAKEMHNKDIKIQIFASDIDKQALVTARRGLYPASIATDIIEKHWDKYFTEEKGLGFRVKKILRDMILFSDQNVIYDPPFSKIDLICCRNLLIYLGPVLQKRLIPLFHYALKPDGFLFIGTSENIGGFSNLFSVVDQKSKIFQANSSPSDDKTISFSDYEPFSLKLDDAIIKVNPHDVTSSNSVKELTEKTLLQKVLKTAILINGIGDIFYFHGHSGEYLEPVPGKADINNILKMAREGLHRELTIALHRTVSSNESVFYPNIRVKTNGSYTFVNLSIHPVESDFNAHTPPFKPAGIENGLYLVVLEHSNTEPMQSIDQFAPNNPNETKRIKRLEHELKAMEAYIQTTNEQLETANEELQSSNEEMQSLNEELQSTNEELETSKEELQSINEELTTVNSELQAKNLELTKNNDDMKNLLAGTGIGTVFVGFNLEILRFNPSITNIMNLISSDVGRPISHIASNLVGYTALIEDAQQVLDTLVPKEIEVVTIKGQYFNMSIRPYRTLENVIAGLVITFVDITQRKKLEKSLIDLNVNMAEAVLNIIKQPLLVLDCNLKVVFASQSFYSTFIMEPSKTIGCFVYTLGDAQLNIPALRESLEDVLSKNVQLNDYKVVNDSQNLGKRTFLLSARHLFGEPNQFDLIFLAFEDVTEEK